MGACNEMNTVMLNLRKRSEYLQQGMDKMQETFKEDLKKLIPRILETIGNLEEDLVKSDINKKDAEIEDVCAFLMKLKLSIDEMQT